MKLKTATFIVCLLSLIADGKEFRIFTDDQGRAIEAKVIAYDPVKGNVQVERTDGKRVWVSPGMFSESDQAYLKEWIAANRVLSDESLRVSFDKVRVDRVKKGMTDEERTTEGVDSDIICYEITFQNRSKKPIGKLKIEYRYYVETVGDDIPKGTMKDSKTGTLTVDRIEPGERVSLKTGNLSLDEKFSKTAIYETRFSGSSQFVGYEMDKKSKDELKGIWLKIYGPEVGGDPSVRDVSEPAKLLDEFKWQD